MTPYATYLTNFSIEPKKNRYIEKYRNTLHKAAHIPILSRDGGAENA
nr:MAG TPA: hypothetical protein [Bacteriophage sp.]